MSVTDPTVGDPSTVALVRELARALDEGGIRWCHFKSNAALDRTRRAENDLDLLVARPDAAAFAGILGGLGFKQAQAHPSKALPGVLDYYGFDPGAERLVHVHAHHQLVVGDDLTKNYRIPLEEAYLGCGARDGEFPIPTPELELLLLIIRLTIKHLTWDAMIARLSRISASARTELAYLDARVDEAQLARDLERWLPMVPPEVFAACRRALRPQAGRPERIRAGSRLLAALEPCARRPRHVDVAVKLGRRGEGLARRVARRPVPRKRLTAGGAVVAFIGADGAGKSTAIEAVSGWLRGGFASTRVHLGRPPKSAVTRAVTAAVLAPSVPAALLRRAGLVQGSAATAPQHAVLAVALARDRYGLARAARRAATGGTLVISDRYPLEPLTIMDAPRAARILGDRAETALGRRLVALEQGYYDRMPSPDVLIVLRLDPEVAVARKPEEPADFVRERWEAMLAVDWDALPVHVVDAGRPAAEVHEEIKAIIWSQV